MKEKTDYTKTCNNESLGCSKTNIWIGLAIIVIIMAISITIGK